MLKKEQEEEELSKPQDSRASAWNISESIMMLIGNLLRQATSLYVKGDLRGCLFRYKAIKFQIFNRFTQEEREMLLTLEKDMHTKSDYKIKEIPCLRIIR